jgi:hypothetical protein
MQIQQGKDKPMGTKRCLRVTMSVLLCVVLAGGWGPTWARTIYVDDGAPELGNGSSWASALRYLQDALTIAKAGDEIRVAQGEYLPDQGGGNAAGDRNATFQVPAGVTIQGGFAGVGAGDPDLRDSTLFATILTGNLAGNDDDPNDPATWFDNSFHVVTADGVGNDTVLEGLMIAHGNAADGAGGSLDGIGGGLRNIGATYLVRDCTFLHNRAHDGGAGVMNTDSNAVFVGCTFLENWCDDGDGGGMANHRSHIRMDDCRFLRNYVDDDGGGLYGDGSLEAINCEFLENGASERGGGVIVDHATFFNCVFRANHSGEGEGAISGGDVRLILCRFIDNFSWEGVGGGVCGDTVAVNCTFANNSGEGAGALAARGYLSHCTFYGNVGWGEGWGEGWRAGAVCGPVTARGCIFWSSIFWSNGVWRTNEDDGKYELMTEYADQIGGDPNGATLEYCCIQGWTPERGGIGNIGADPLFVAPDQNDFHLQSQAGHWDATTLAWVLDDVTSPCIDAGDPNSPVEQEPFPNGGRVNMGAYGGTCEASKSWFGVAPGPGVEAADLNGDGRVDAEDLRLALLRQPQTVAPE